ncbi:hypothetical protein K438DRAFT_1926709 [Mycena galopus ATCC 62051]|nr:hypothetical protein K438DRAFT_1926709 [Mycena galopus ATCC 62051]
MTTSTPFSMFFLSLCIPALSLLSPPTLALDNRNLRRWPIERRDSNLPRSEPAAGYFPVASGGGAMLTMAPGTFPPAGEPLNVIVTGNSDAAVLVDQQNDGGWRNFWLSVGFAAECLGQHEGAPQTANLGDGNGFLNETDELRWDYGDPSLGTCKETVEGGNHFRYWRQTGSSADSGAYFLASSYELPIAQQHNIIVNGYDLGRDWLIGNITNDGVNHASSVGINGANAVDGLVAVVTISITEKPANATSTSGARRTTISAQAPLVGALVPTLLLLLLGALYL